MPPVDRHAFKRLSALEARRALYIDFEGEKDKPPVLLGVLRRPGRGAEPSVHQVVLDSEFEPAGPAGPVVRDLRNAVEIVVVRAEHGDRRIVSWSEHDLEVVRTLGEDEPELVARFERRYVNALALAKRWVNKLCPEVTPADGTLAGYLALINYEVPPAGVPGRVGKTIRALRPTLRDGRSLTPGQRRRWVDLLEHNRHDCAGMRAVCLRAARELERQVDGVDQSRWDRSATDQRRAAIRCRFPSKTALTSNSPPSASTYSRSEDR